MCGIAGGVALDPTVRPSPELVSYMSGAMRHRGPDGEGLWTSPSGGACLAHRRLAVIDLETGQQPLAADDGTCCLVFNGEVYNYIELRHDLEQRGETFKTRSDTEVLLTALRRQGAAALAETVGMFAFAFWDDERRALLLARDRVGKKPLFYTIREGCLYFCSTLGGLEKVFPRRPDINCVAVANYLDLGYVPAPETIYQDVWKLSAATYLTVSQSRPAPSTSRFWNPAPDPREPRIERRSALLRFEDLLEDAVGLRLRSDVPLGIFLSGGIDSSLVTAFAVRQSPHSVKTFTISFDEGEFDEAARARDVAGHLGTEHHEFRVAPNIVELLPRVISHFGEPFADSAALPLWYLSERAREHVTVALLGDGGDEGFAGYDWYRTADRLDRLARATSVTPLDMLVRVYAVLGGRRAKRLASLVTEDSAERFADLRCLFDVGTTDTLFTPGFKESLSQDLLSRGRISALYRERPLSAVLRMQYADLRTYLADGLLPKVDISTMAHSLEARAPLLDHRVLEFAYGLPAELQDVRRPKALLKQLLGRHVPSRLTRGPKQGFTVPLRDWFRGALRPMVEGLAQGTLVDTGWFHRAGIVELLRDHLENRRDNSERLYHLLVLNMWLDR